MPMFEAIPFAITLCGHTRVTRWWNYRQFNPFSKLYYIQDGEARFLLDGNWIRLRPGRLYLVPSHRPIELACDGEMTHYWVHFTCELAAGLTLFDLLGHTPELAPPAPADAERFMARIVTLHGQPAVTEADTLEAQGCLRILLAWFLRAAGGRSGGGVRLPDMAPFTDLLQYIHEHLDRPLTVTELAGRMHWHPNYFITRFRAALGVSPKAYVIRKRLERARQLLWAGTDPVKAVAAAAGYDNPAHFTRRFHAVTGMTPARYRKRSHEENAP